MIVVYALVVVALNRCADLILGVDAFRGVGGPTRAQAAFYGGKW